jgi:hypothetical protein
MARDSKQKESEDVFDILNEQAEEVIFNEDGRPHPSIESALETATSYYERKDEHGDIEEFVSIDPFDENLESLVSPPKSDSPYFSGYKAGARIAVFAQKAVSERNHDEPYYVEFDQDSDEIDESRISPGAGHVAEELANFYGDQLSTEAAKDITAQMDREVDDWQEVGRAAHDRWFGHHAEAEEAAGAVDEIPYGAYIQGLKHGASCYDHFQ